MKFHTRDKEFKNKNVRVKGKIIDGCYFEGCSIRNDKYSILTDCYFTGCSFSHRFISITNVIK